MIGTKEGQSLVIVNKSHAKSISIVSSSGEVRSFVSCAEACRNTGLNSSRLSKLLNGKAKSTKGWKLF